LGDVKRESKKKVQTDRRGKPRGEAKWLRGKSSKETANRQAR